MLRKDEEVTIVIEDEPIEDIESQRVIKQRPGFFQILADFINEYQGIDTEDDIKLKRN